MNTDNKNFFECNTLINYFYCYNMNTTIKNVEWNNSNNSYANFNMSRNSTTLHKHLKNYTVPRIGTLEFHI